MNLPIFDCHFGWERRYRCRY